MPHSFVLLKNRREHSKGRSPEKFATCIRSANSGRTIYTLKLKKGEQKVKGGSYISKRTRIFIRATRKAESLDRSSLANGHRTSPEEGRGNRRKKTANK